MQQAAGSRTDALNRGPVRCGASRFIVNSLPPGRDPARHDEFPGDRDARGSTRERRRSGCRPSSASRRRRSRSAPAAEIDAGTPRWLGDVDNAVTNCPRVRMWRAGSASASAMSNRRCRQCADGSRQLRRDAFPGARRPTGSSSAMRARRAVTVCGAPSCAAVEAGLPAGGAGPPMKVRPISVQRVFGGKVHCHAPTSLTSSSREAFRRFSPARPAPSGLARRPRENSRADGCDGAGPTGLQDRTASGRRRRADAGVAGPAPNRSRDPFERHPVDTGPRATATGCRAAGRAPTA